MKSIGRYVGYNHTKKVLVSLNDLQWLLLVVIKGIDFSVLSTMGFEN